MHSILTMVTLLLLDLMIITLMGHPSRMILQCPNTSGHMLLEYLIRHCMGCDTCSCPCNTGVTAQVPPYVGNDYYCETGNNVAGYSQAFFSNDTLWDGQQCDGLEAPCCTHSNMLWFTKTLGETTTEDIQLRLCNDQGIAEEETLLQLISLYTNTRSYFILVL